MGMEMGRRGRERDGGIESVKKVKRGNKAKTRLFEGIFITSRLNLTFEMWGLHKIRCRSRMRRSNAIDTPDLSPARVDSENQIKDIDASIGAGNSRNTHLAPVFIKGPRRDATWPLLWG